MTEKFEEVNFKKNFCEKYFDKGTWDLDVLNQVDVHLKDKKGNSLLYIESKYMIKSIQELLKARAQVILTNKKQKQILSHVALIYQNENKHNILEYINCSDNSVMYNNDINWKQEKPSNPTKDAIDRINDRIRDKITYYIDDEIIEFYKKLKKKQDIQIDITENNFNVVYNQWKNEIKFKEQIQDEQDLINLFLADLLNNTKYKKSVISSVEEHTLFGTYKIGTKEEDGEQDLIREGTNLSKYEIKEDAIVYHSTQSSYYEVEDKEKYNSFWRKYKRPPEKNEFLKILEQSATLYSDKYRRDTGGEYTPTCFVEKQNEILLQHYDINDFIICDPCAGVGNLENQFGKEFKQYCYLSTLEEKDVDICKIKGFENAIRYDYLMNNQQPKWKYKGQELDINEICKRENKKLMIVMNPPYKNVKGIKNNLAIEFFNKVLKLNPQIIVFYYMTESFLRDEIEHYKKSGYKIVSHIFSNAKTTFLLSEWPISQVIFDKDNGEEIKDNHIKADRYELEKEKFVFKKTYIYDNSQPSLLDEIDDKIRKERKGLLLGNYAYMSDTINLTNKITVNTKLSITTDNLKYCLLSKGINFNTHNKYYERNFYLYKGKLKDIKTEIFNDSIMFSLFFKNCAFSNKGQKNYIMPFTAEELDCSKNDLNVLYPQDNDDLLSSCNTEEPFDFREFLKQFNFSKEAKNLYNAALEIFKFYHKSSQYTNKDYNDSFYDITNAIMGKDTSTFKSLDTDNDKRISKTKTTKGTKGFGRNTIKYVVNSKDLPIFEKFFDARDVLAKKINRQLVEQGLLLWERENIY